MRALPDRGSSSTPRRGGLALRTACLVLLGLASCVPGPDPAARVVPPVGPAAAASDAPGTPAPDPAPAIPGPDGLEEILLDLRFARLARTTVPALAVGSRALLPAFAFLELAEVDVERDAAGSVHALLHPSGRSLHFSATSPVTRAGDRVLELNPDEIVVRDDDVYIETSVLAAMLGVSIRVDRVDLSATVVDPDELPLARRLRREAQWDRLTARSASTTPADPLALDVPALGGAILDWGVSGRVDDPQESLAWSAALGARVLGGSLRASSRSFAQSPEAATRTDATWERVVRGSSWVRQIRLGDGFTTGPRLRNVRGFALTNAPYFRGSEFVDQTFRGRVGPGWDVELRQAGRTVDLTRADEQGAFALDVPLQYGENQIQIVAFGPHGEVVTSGASYLADAELIRGGAFEWGLSAGACRTPRCDAAGNLDLRWGVSDRITLRAGTEASTTTVDADVVVQPYIRASALLLPSLHVSGEALRAGHLRAMSVFAPSPRLRLRGAVTAFSSALAEPVFHDGRRRSTVEADVFLRPDPSRPRLFLRGSLLDQRLDDGTLGRIQGSATVPLGPLAIEAGVRHEIDESRGSVRSNETTHFASLFGSVRPFGGRLVWLRTEIEVRSDAVLDGVRGQLGYQLSDRFRLDVGGGWRKFFGPNLTVSLNALLPGLRSIVQLNAVEDEPATVTQFSRGTVYWDEATRRLDVAPGPGLERGGLSGFVFLDENGNGVRDRGERGVEGVRLVVGGRPVVSDARGRHVAWDLLPWREVEIRADSASIPDPTLVPGRSRIRVAVPPSSFGRVDVPLTPSREIAGTVLQVEAEGADGLAVPYADVELVAEGTGELRALRAFSDGQFYAAGVRPGTYTLRLSREYLDRVGLQPAGAWPRVEVTLADPLRIVDAIELRVVRTPEAATDDGWIEAPSRSGDARR